MHRHSTTPTHGRKVKWVIISVVEVSFVSFPLSWWDPEHAGYEDKVWSAGLKTHRKGDIVEKVTPMGTMKELKKDFMVVQ